MIFLGFYRGYKPIKSLLFSLSYWIALIGPQEELIELTSKNMIKDIKICLEFHNLSGFHDLMDSLTK